MKEYFKKVWNCKGRHWNHSASCKPDNPCFGCEWRWEASLTEKQAREAGLT